MTPSFRNPLACAGLVCCLLPAPGAFAQDGERASADASSWGVGLAVMRENKPYRDFDDRTRALPMLSYENRWVRVLGPGVELKLGQAGPLAYGLSARYADDGYESGDSPALAGMSERKASFWLGGRASLRTDIATVNAEWSGDVSGHSKGQKFKLGLERRFGFGALGVTPSLSATWLDRKFVQYYYGVEAAEATATRAAYAPGSTVNTRVGLRLDYLLAPQHLLFGDLGVESLGRAIEDSPLVDRRTVPEVRFGYVYRF